jgi:hypothetical protein
MKFRIMLLLLVVANAPLPARAQALADSVDSPSPVVVASPPAPVLSYVRPTEKTKLYNYAFDAFGPFPLVGAGIAAGINLEFIYSGPHSLMSRMHLNNSHGAPGPTGPVSTP